jgi:hypothetical protein
MKKRGYRLGWCAVYQLLAAHMPFFRITCPLTVHRRHPGQLSAATTRRPVPVD